MFERIFSFRIYIMFTLDHHRCNGFRDVELNESSQNRIQLQLWQSY